MRIWFEHCLNNVWSSFEHVLRTVKFNQNMCQKLLRFVFVRLLIRFHHCPPQFLWWGFSACATLVFCTISRIAFSLGLYTGLRAYTNSYGVGYREKIKNRIPAWVLYSKTRSYRFLARSGSNPMLSYIVRNQVRTPQVNLFGE